MEGGGTGSLGQRFPHDGRSGVVGGGGVLMTGVGCSSRGAVWIALAQVEVSANELAKSSHLSHLHTYYGSAELQAKGFSGRLLLCGARATCSGLIKELD